VQTWRTSSIQRFHQVELVVSSVSSPGDGGSIYVGARSAATLGVVTTRSASMRRCMRARQVTRSSAALSRARRGFGTIAPTSTSKDLAWHHRCTIRSTNLYQDPPAVFRPTGKTFWWNRDALGRDRFGVSCMRTRRDQRHRRASNPRSTPPPPRSGCPSPQRMAPSRSRRALAACSGRLVVPRVRLRLS
jgi:hypothetical protein